MQQKDDAVLEARKAKLKPPPMFKVMLLNDDYTPMEFVVAVLQKFFAMSRERATQVMLKVHREGIGVCGVYPKDVVFVPRSLAERATNLVRWTVMPRGGHYGPSEQPAAAVGELTTFFHALRDAA